MSENAEFGLKILNDESNKLLTQFLERQYRVNKHNGDIYKSAIFRCLKKIKKYNILSIDDDDLINYFNIFEQNGYTASYKMNQYHYINSFFKYIELRYRRQKNRFLNPVLPIEEYKFTPDDPLSDKEQQEKIENATYDIEQLKEILRVSHESSYKYYMANLILEFCGMRPGEVLSIEIENVNIEERYLLTGIKKGARKSIKITTNGVYYCFPEEVADQLFDYIHYLKAKKPDNIWLFPGRYSNSHIERSSIIKYMKSRLDFKYLLHQFRRTIATFRQTINGVETPTHILEMLSNHKITSLEHRVYAKIPIEKRRADYDRYFPSEYRELLKFISKF